jgi:hypothetical protein
MNFKEINKEEEINLADANEHKLGNWKGFSYFDFL